MEAVGSAIGRTGKKKKAKQKQLKKGLAK